MCTSPGVVFSPYSKKRLFLLLGLFLFVQDRTLIFPPFWKRVLKDRVEGDPPPSPTRPPPWGISTCVRLVSCQSPPHVNSCFFSEMDSVCSVEPFFFLGSPLLHTGGLPPLLFSATPPNAPLFSFSGSFGAVFLPLVGILPIPSPSPMALTAQIPLRPLRRLTFFPRIVLYLCS